MGGRKKIGVLALQGAFVEHQQVLEKCGAETLLVKSKKDLDRIEGLIIPGGESTTIGRLLVDYDLMDPVREGILQGMPVLGTCAGMIVLAKKIVGYDQARLGVLDIAVRRNAFGRQVDSFEADLEIKGFDHKVRGIFIRAPYVEEVWGETEVLCEFEGRIVMVKEKNMLACSFHPELTQDVSVHRYFIDQT